MNLRLPYKQYKKKALSGVPLCILLIVFAFLSIILGLYLSPLTDRLNLFLFVNLLVIVLLTWVTIRSFSPSLRDLPVIPFRMGIVLILCSTLVSVACGLKMLTRNQAGLITVALSVSSAILFIYSLNQLVTFMKSNYLSALNLSLTDELTGLPNRRHLNIRLKEFDNQPGIICLIDIDNFKRINDTFGHDAGDAVLERAGFLLSSFCGKNVFVARAGGEEFVVIISELDNYKELLENIQHSMSTNSIRGNSVTVSMGVALKHADQTASFAMMAADAALYESKYNGKNKISYSSTHSYV
ncbi:GGDEF domain-containing protein [Candidatus Pantoea formicae]|uniref:GGDEF domain-containing protein n=1 Tax=Candidatus Pantoea formicae TaxID=2608355 RepID=UPI003ED945EB